MLRKQIQNYINNKIETGEKTLEVYNEEYNYIHKHNLLDANTNMNIIEGNSRFNDAYIERSDKETEELLSEENHSFLNQPLTYLKDHKNEFIYLESPWFDIIGVDAVSIEVDDVFGNYDVMLGLKIPKKLEKALKDQLLLLMQNDSTSFELSFSQNDGLWDVNFSLNAINEFHEEMTIGSAYQLVYTSIFQLIEVIEEK
ncbi:branched-chain amino acid aminotransferase [Bacillus sp. PS06]|uniref:branched-chain amino acid aminotransferase n=1 Tax=Bacillus sp. PS06 TaxID=2764176 RepID=UPI001785B82B|nr:branched-chain amino acid aminotransferase [Bacillus sp. PS06]MBD8067973.1 branched-chain amino acid aminotransferase [Bacillus sp. PS06]